MRSLRRRDLLVLRSTFFGADSDYHGELRSQLSVLGYEVPDLNAENFAALIESLNAEDASAVIEELNNWRTYRLVREPDDRTRRLWDIAESLDPTIVETRPTDESPFGGTWGPTETTSDEAPDAAAARSGVFVVYGTPHNHVRKAFESLLGNMGLEVREWDDAYEAGDYTFEMVARHLGTAAAIIVLFTPDEVVEPTSGGGRRLQPRPNVLIEAGWAAGMYKKRTLFVEVGMVLEASDFDGKNNLRFSDRSSFTKKCNLLKGRLQKIDGLRFGKEKAVWNSASEYPDLFKTATLPTGTPPTQGEFVEKYSDDTARERLKNAMRQWRDGLFRTWVDMAAGAFPAGDMPPEQIKRVAEAAAREEGWPIKKVTEDGMNLEVAPISIRRPPRRMP